MHRDRRKDRDRDGGILGRPEQRLRFRLCLALGVRHPDYLDLTPWQEADWLAFHALEGVGGEAAEDARAMRLAVAGQCPDVAVIRSLFDREHATTPEEIALAPPSDEERETLRRFEESLRDRRARGDKI